MPRKDFEYFAYHCFPKPLKRIKLFKDDEDKLVFLLILANTCIQLGLALFAFNVLTNHSHFLIGLKWESGLKPEQSWLYHQIKYFIWNVNRLYGAHYRKKYNHKGDIFAKNVDFFKPVIHPGDFINKVCYIHNNTNFAGMTSVFEEGQFNSYNFYVSALFLNPEFQNLPVIKMIASSPDALKIFNALDMDYTIRMFAKGTSFKNGVLNFIEAHQKSLAERDRTFRDQRSLVTYKNLGLFPLYQNTKLIEISAAPANGSGHNVRCFINYLKSVAITLENAEGYFHTFSSFFPKEGNGTLRESFMMLRSLHLPEFECFKKEILKRISRRKFEQISGLNRKTL
ncbi:MAG: hypothetical protein WCL54_06510 [Clostridia bacterium]